jgi:hypothetical protein
MSKIPGPDISREELAEARDAVRRQIAMLDGGGDLWGFRLNTGGAASAKLREVLAELNEGWLKRRAPHRTFN